MRRTLLLAGSALLAVVALTGPASAALDPEPLTTFGSGGTGEGEFVNPTGVGVDAKGRIYVSDDLNNRIQKFAPNTSFLSEFGATPPASLNRPYGLDVDFARKRIWVASSNNNKVVQLEQNGDFVSSFGGTSEITIAITYDVAVDQKNGDVYIADLFSDRIVRISKNGTYRDHWPITGTNDVLLRGVVVDPKNRQVYVTDDGNDRVAVYTRQGDFVREWDSWTGGSVSGFDGPWGITANRNRVYVADNSQGLVFEFTRAGVYTGETDGGTQSMATPTALNMTKNGKRLFVAGGDEDKVYKFRTG